jgi:dihydroflavonol-4-reductase
MLPPARSGGSIVCIPHLWNGRGRRIPLNQPARTSLAERAAWDFVENESPSFDLVVINPTGVIGPSIGSGLSTTSKVIADLLNGGVYPAIIDMTFPYVDVRDVAEAHVRAAENPDAAGRYICSNELVSMQRTVDVLRENGFGIYKLPKMNLTSNLASAS